MEQAIQSYLADDRQYQDRITAALSQVEEKGAEYEALCQQRAQLGIWQKIITFWQFRRDIGHCCKVSDEAAFCLIQRPYISKTLLT
ncbi:hypothetical protein ACLH00_24875, partial [Enterobacter asburiae]